MRAVLRVACFVVGGLVVLSGCSHGWFGDLGEPSVSVSPTSPRKDDRPDVLSVSVPSGWVFRPGKEFGIAEDWRVAQAGENPDRFTGISFTFVPRSTISTAYRIPIDAETIDLSPILERRMGYLESHRSTAEISTHPAREIGGVSGKGLKFKFNYKKTYLAQEWLLWREDGLWRVIVYGPPGGGPIPQELLGCLDTVKWTKP